MSLKYCLCLSMVILHILLPISLGILYSLLLEINEEKWRHGKMSTPYFVGIFYSNLQLNVCQLKSYIGHPKFSWCWSSLGLMSLKCCCSLSMAILHLLLLISLDILHSLLLEINEVKWRHGKMSTPLLCASVINSVFVVFLCIILCIFSLIMLITCYLYYLAVIYRFNYVKDLNICC